MQHTSTWCWVFLSHFTFALFTSGKLFTKICLFPSLLLDHLLFVCTIQANIWADGIARYSTARKSIGLMLCCVYFISSFFSFRCCFHYSPHLYHTIFGASALVFSQQLRDYDSYPTDDDLKELASRCYNSFAICICHFIE